MTTAMFKTGMNRSLLTKDFFQTILNRAYGPNVTKAQVWSEEEIDASASILSNISAGDDDDDSDDDDFEQAAPASSSTNPLRKPSKDEVPCPMNDMTGHFLYKIEYKTLLDPAQSMSHARDHLLRPHLSKNLLSTANSSTLSGPQAPTTMDSTVAVSTAPSTSDGQLYVVIKSKPIDTALIELTNIMAQLQGGDLADEYDPVKDLTGFRNSHIRELELAELSWKVRGAMEHISTKVYNVLRNDANQLYALCLEFLDPGMGNITHMNSTNIAPQIWTTDHIHQTLKDLASFHAQFLGQERALLGMGFLENPTRALLNVLHPVYEQMVKTNRHNLPDVFSPFLTQVSLDYLKHSDEYWAVLESNPRTLIHGDFNTRNICLRLDPETGAQSLCAYDWELACCHVPQRDVVEFLSFVLPPGSTEWSHYIEYHRLALKASYEALLRAPDAQTPSPLAPRCDIHFPSPQEYKEVAKIALMDFASMRIAMYGISSSFKEIDWLPRIVHSVEEQIRRLGPPVRARKLRLQQGSKL